MRTLHLGHRGEDVSRWQRFLASQKLKPGPIDGVFGVKTQKATITFQEAHQLVPNGSVGPRTRAAAQGLGFTNVETVDLSREVPVPPASQINVGLNAAKHDTMMQLLGAPGKLTKQCSPVTNAQLKKETVTASVGPFRVTGWKPAVDSLRKVMNEIGESMPEVLEQVQTAGMSCVRHVRQNPRRFSNHSWGTAVDLFFGSDVDDVGDGMTQLGLLKMAPVFNKHRWYWGAEFSLEDSMHFEVSNELIREVVGR